VSLRANGAATMLFEQIVWLDLRGALLLEKTEHGLDRGVPA
jgi:hypothetical protein